MLLVVHSCEGGGKGDGASLGNRLRLSIRFSVVDIPPHCVVPDMRKAVNAALHTKYESGKWKKWFVETAKRVSKELDGESTDANVGACLCARMFVLITFDRLYLRSCESCILLWIYMQCCFFCLVHVQSFDMSVDESVDDTPKKLKSTKKQNGKLTKILSTDFDGDSNVRACSCFMTCTGFAVSAFTCTAYIEFLFLLRTFAEFRR